MTRHDKHELPEWLEDRNLEISTLIETLRTAKELSVSLSSSPVNMFTSIVVDLLMRLKQFYEYGVPKSERTNPTVRFDYRHSGPLGNPLQITSYSKRDEAWSPQLSAFCKELSIFFSRSLKTDFNFQKDFHDLLKGLNKFLPPGVLSQKSEKAEKNQKHIKKVRNKSRNFYYHRRRQNK